MLVLFAYYILLANERDGSLRLSSDLAALAARAPPPAAPPGEKWSF